MLRWVVILLSALLCSSCSQAVPVYLTSSDATHGKLTERSEKLLDESFEFWGLEWEPSDMLYGSVYIALVDVDEPVTNYEGAAIQEVLTCRRTLWSNFDRDILAHELGHAFGLDHVDDKNNIMYPRVPDGPPETTDEQWDLVQNGVDRFLLCR